LGHLDAEIGAGRSGGGSDELAAVIGASPAIEGLRAAIRGFAGRAFKTLLVRGETGSGKELAAAAVRACSGWRHGPFESISAPAVPPDQLESELFGTARGAFTGAVDRRGLIEDLHGGVLFIDEIAAMRLDHQAKLLRFIDTGCARRLGATRSYRVEIGILAATNEDLEAKIQRGEFREDLYFRLVQDGVIWVPPLRERADDAVRIARGFLAELGQFSVEPGAEAALLEHAWPGNVRELRAVCRRLARARAAGAVTRDDVLVAVAELRAPALRSPPQRARAPHGRPPATFAAATEAFQRELLLDALRAAGGNLTEAGVLLGFDQRESDADAEPSARRARQLAHRRFSYWFRRLVANEADVPRTLRELVQ
jgi:DNA-binding NtrC family response regulator